MTVCRGYVAAALLILAASLPLQASVPLLKGSPCGDHFRQHHATGSAPFLSQEIELLQSYAERALVYREKSITFYRYIDEKMSKGLPLSGADLDTQIRAWWSIWLFVSSYWSWHTLMSAGRFWIRRNGSVRASVASSNLRG